MLRSAAAANPYELAILDMQMPEMDGLEALRHIRKLSPQVRVVMLSTLTERGAAITLEALALGADDYMTKPFSAAELLEKMRELLNGGAPDGPRATV